MISNLYVRCSSDKDNKCFQKEQNINCPQKQQNYPVKRNKITHLFSKRFSESLHTQRIYIFQGFTSNMHKSSPLIEDAPANKVTRSSKRSSIQRNSNDYQNHRVPNPFLQLPNMLPPGLLQEIGNLQYLTPSQLQKIAWGQAVSVPRRSSVFSRHLEVMQKAVREQQEKMGTPKTKHVCFVEEMQQQSKYSLSLEDHVEEDFQSQGQRHQWALQPLQMEQQGFPVTEQWCNQRPFQFYSMTELSNDINDWDNYFNV